MQFSLPSFKHAHARAVIVFDVGAGSVGAGIVLIDEGEEASRIVVARRATLSAEERNEKQLIVAIAHAFETAGKAVLDTYAKSSYAKGAGAIADVYVTVHAPWVRSGTTDGMLTFKTPTVIGKEMVGQAGGQKGKESEPAPADHKPLERMVVRVELNGYPTGDPIGKTAMSLRAVILESTIGGEMQSALQHSLDTLLSGRTPKIHSAVFAYSRVIHELAPTTDEYMFLDIGSEASTAVVINDGATNSLSTIPVGFRTLLRKAGEAGHMNVQETLSQITMIAEGASNDSVGEGVLAALAAAETEYMKAFGEVFGTLTKTRRLPNTLFLSIHPKLSLWAKGFFGRIDFGQFTETGKPFNGEVLSSRVLTPLVVYGGTAHPDSGIGASAALVHIEQAL